jgi:hypothetical protein
MTVPAHRVIGFSFILRVAALVLFIVAVIAGFANWSTTTWEELVAAGLACWVASTLIP